MQNKRSYTFTKISKIKVLFSCKMSIFIYGILRYFSKQEQMRETDFIIKTVHFLIKLWKAILVSISLTKINVLNINVKSINYNYTISLPLF